MKERRRGFRHSVRKKNDSSVSLVLPQGRRIEACYWELPASQLPLAWEMLFPYEARAVSSDIPQDQLAKKIEMALCQKGWRANVVQKDTIFVSAYGGESSPPPYLEALFLKQARAGGWIRWQGDPPIEWRKEEGKRYLLKWEEEQ